MKGYIMANDDTVVAHANGKLIRLNKVVAIDLVYKDGQEIRPEDISKVLQLNAQYSIEKFSVAGETRPRNIPYDNKAYFRRWYK